MPGGSVRQIVVFGAGGQVGTELLRLRAPAGWVIRGVSRQEADVGSWNQVRDALGEGPVGLIVNAAADTAVDRAESQPELAFAANRDGAAHCARAARDLGVPLVHLSTDYVFDGNKPEPYTEADPVRPLGVYGASKAQGESAVRDLWPRAVVLRTAWVFSAHGRNFVRTMLRLGREREELGIVDDQTGGPTAAADIARAALAIGERLVGGADLFGTYHFAGAPAVTWYGFARTVFELAAERGYRPPRLKPITTAEYPTPAARPRNSALDMTRIGQAFGIAPPDWRHGLALVLDELLGADAAGDAVHRG